MFDPPEGFAESLRTLSEPVSVVLNDMTRPSQAELVRGLGRYLPKRFRVLFATGTHRPVSEDEARPVLRAIGGKPVAIESNFSDSGVHVPAGTTSLGTPVEVHPWLLEGSILAVNTVEPHYFAGFTGGRKSLLPGCSSRRTIVANHYLACLPEARPGVLEGNPVHSDLEEGAELICRITPCMMINGVAGGKETFFGTLRGSFEKAAEVAAERFGVPVEKRFRHLEVHPGGKLAVNLYQAMKAVYMWESAVAEGGHLVLEASCTEGFGAPQMGRILTDSAKKFNVPGSRREYSLGDHSTVRLALARKRIRISFRTPLGMDRFGFQEPPAPGEVRIERAGYLYPVLSGEDA